MAEGQMTQEQILEMQKKNCIFCKLISGEMQSKKVYEDDLFLAVLDIKPATAGHVLLLPKQHTPILQLLPETQLRAMFALSVKLGTAVKDAMIAERVTLFIASGSAAGQQALHAMVHIIPRERGDGLDALDLVKLDTPQADAIALSSLFVQVTEQSLQHLGKEDLLKKHHIHKKESADTSAERNDAGGAGNVSSPAAVGDGSKENDVVERNTPPSTSTPSHSPSVPSPSVPSPSVTPPHSPSVPSPVPPPSDGPSITKEFDTSQEALLQMLEMYPDLRRLIIAQPDLVTDYVGRSPQLARLFDGIDIRALSLVLQRQERERESRDPAVKRIAAADMSEGELFAFIDGNEGIRQWLLEHPDELAARLGENPRLQAFFFGIDIHELAKRYRAYRQTKGDA